MTINIVNLLIYHITDLSNLPLILASGGLHSDATLNIVGVQPTVIGHNNIKQRRLREIVVPCSANRFVGEFVPFYFCPRSPMLFTINRGNTGRPAGCQKDIVHLVSSVGIAIGLERNWAFSNGNAGAYHADFYCDIAQLDSELDWGIIGSNDWGGVRRHKKSAEFLVADFFPWTGIKLIGCYNTNTAQQAIKLLEGSDHVPAIKIKQDWYY